MLAAATNHSISGDHDAALVVDRPPHPHHPDPGLIKIKRAEALHISDGARQVRSARTCRWTTPWATSPKIAPEHHRQEDYTGNQCKFPLAPASR